MHIAPLLATVDAEMERCSAAAARHGLRVEVTVSVEVQQIDMVFGGSRVGFKSGFERYTMEIVESRWAGSWTTAALGQRRVEFPLRDDDVLTMLTRLADAYEHGQGLSDFYPPWTRPMEFLLKMFNLNNKPWKGYVAWR
jgi:hypothetical protein